MEWHPAGKAPVCDGQGASFRDFEQQVLIWARASKTDCAGRASMLVLRMNSAPRQVCPSAGGDHLDDGEGVLRLWEIPRSYLAPQAVVAQISCLMD